MPGYFKLNAVVSLVQLGFHIKSAKCSLVRAVFECRKTKTKVTTLANHKRHSDNPVNQSKFEVNARSWHEAREKVGE